MNEITPQIKPSTPLSLKKNIINELKMEKTKMKKKFLKRILAVAAVFVGMLTLPFIFTANNTANAAIKILDESIDKSSDLQTMTIKLLMLTLPQENFADIRYDGEMIEHTFTVLFANNPKWRLEKKGGRIVVYDGNKSYFWMDNIGLTSYDANDFIEGFSLFINPKEILKYEEQMAKNNNSEIVITENESQIMLTIKAKPNVSENDYFKDSDILTSHNKRSYVFDKETKLLQSLKIQVLHNNEYTTVLETTSIQYNIPVDESSILQLPENIKWVDVDAQLDNALLTNVSAKQAANVILKALSDKNIEPVKEAFRGWDMKRFDGYFGLQILEIGDSFTSEIYSGEIVPCKVKFVNGKIKSLNLALKNDNKGKVWVIDGGI